MKKLFTIFFVSAIWSAQAIPATAATIAWTNNAGGDYTNAANWSASLPGAADTAAFTLNNSYTVNVSVAAYTNNIINFNAVTNGNVVLNLNSNTLTVAAGSGISLGVSTVAATNTVTIAGGTLNAGYDFQIAGGNANGVATVVMTNDIFTAATLGIAYALGGAVGNGSLSMYGSTGTVTVLQLANPVAAGYTGTGTLLVANGSLLTIGSSCTFGTSGTNMMATFTISNATVNADVMNVANGVSDVASLNILGSGVLNVTNGIAIAQNGNANGTLLLNGPTAQLNQIGAGGFTFYGQSGTPATLTIAQGACVISNASTYIGYGGTSHGKVLMTGGTLTFKTAVNVADYYNAGGYGEIWLDGPNNPTFTVPNIYLALGGSANWTCMVVVSNGTLHSTSAYYAATGGGVHTTQVSGGTLQVDGTITLGTTTGTNTITVSNRGVLQNNTLTVGATAAGNLNFVNNVGGVYQYTSAAPTLTPGTFGNIAISNGTISFRGIGSVDVMCNQSTKSLDSTNKMAFYGSNGFMLNGATTLATAQTYTFAPGTATNWASLTLTNGAVYQGGAVTIGSGGYLAGAGTIANNLTLSSGSTLKANANGSTIAVSSNLTLGGALVLPVTNSWTPLFTYGGTVSGSFASGVPAGYSLVTTNGVVGLSGPAVKSSMPITFSGYGNTEILTNFPALVTLTNYAGYVYPTFGYDLRFWSGSPFTGTPLNYEIDTWNSLGTSFVWVQVPTLTNNTTIWASWGDTGNSLQPTYTINGATWSQGYVGVWHLGSLNVTDSCAGIPTLSVNALTTNGVVDGALSFTGATANVQWSNSVAQAYNFATNQPFTVEIWMNPVTWAGTTPCVMSKSLSSGNYTGWTMDYSSPSLRFDIANNIGAYDGVNTLSAPLSNQWTHVVASADGSGRASGSYVFFNGTNAALTTAADSLAGSISNAAPLTIAGRNGNNDSFNGSLDEFRVSSVVRSTNWIWATYQNMASNIVFQNYGAVTTSAAKGPPPGVIHLLHL